MPTSHAAVRLQPAWDDPDAVLALIRRAGPYLPLARYAASEAERRAAGGPANNTFVPPWFRVDIATGATVHVDGGAAMLNNEPFVDAATQIFGASSIVEPTTVYVNVMTPCAYPFSPHTDVPVFAGRSRANTPAWLLLLMHASGLFADHRIRMATAVSWFFNGPGGDFHYWPGGPDEPALIERAPFDNVAIVADNEVTLHGVAPVGVNGAHSPVDLTLDATIAAGDDGSWTIVDGERTDTFARRDVRITTSWKGEVFADHAERDAFRGGELDLSVDAVVDTFCEAQGLDRPADALADDAWITSVSEAYPRRRARITTQT